MNSMLAIVMLLVILGLLAFISRRRFGVLGAALVLGYSLQQLWQQEFPAWARLLPLPSGDLISPVTVIGLMMVLLPSLVLLGGGPTYRSKKGRCVGAVVYAVLGVVLCVPMLTYSLVLTGESGTVVAFIQDHRRVIITIAVVLAVVDLLQLHVKMPSKVKPAKH